MEGWVNLATESFTNYYRSFNGLSEQHKQNFAIKHDHSVRVAEMAGQLAEKLQLDEGGRIMAYLTGLFHDAGRFKQLVEYNTFHDVKSVDHARLSVEVIAENGLLKMLDPGQVETLEKAILAHNKKDIPAGYKDEELLLSKILRDADKLDILKVLTDYYSNKNARPNHTLTWELPAGNSVSPKVAKEVLSGKLVSKTNVTTDVDVKVMQLSWVYDLNFKPSFELVMKNRFLEKIYNSLPKNDSVIEIYRKVKVFTENKFLS